MRYYVSNVQYNSIIRKKAVKAEKPAVKAEKPVQRKPEHKANLYAILKHKEDEMREQYATDHKYGYCQNCGILRNLNGFCDICGSESIFLKREQQAKKQANK